MRKLAFTNNINNVKKLIAYKTKGGVYLFGYDCLQDTSANWDNFFPTIEEADECCSEEYNIDNDDWISISEPLANCQHDIIIPTMVKGRAIGQPDFGNLQRLTNGKWENYIEFDRCLSFENISNDGRLQISGLILEYKQAILNDKSKAVKILKALGLYKF